MCFGFVLILLDSGKKSLIKIDIINGFAKKKNRFHHHFFSFARSSDHLQNLVININVVAHEIKWSFKMIFILLDYLPIQYGLLMFIVDHSFSDASINCRLRPGLVEFYDRSYISFNKVVNLIGFWLNFRRNNKIFGDHINCDQWS